MGMLSVRHKVRDYGQWRPVFDQHAAMQREASLINPRVYHSADSNKSGVSSSSILRTQNRRGVCRVARPQEAIMAAGVDGLTLVAWYAPAEECKQPSFNSTATRQTPPIAGPEPNWIQAHGFDVLYLNNRGYGGSGGRCTEVGVDATGLGPTEVHFAPLPRGR
jgi:hypothetical protein